MPFLHTAATDLWIGDRRVGDRVTQFRTLKQTSIKEVTGIAHDRRTRADAGLRDDGFDIAGLLEPDVVDSLEAGGGDMIFAQGRTAGVSRVFRLNGRIQPEDAIEHPVGDFVRLKANGNLNVEPIEGRVMAYRRIVGSIPNGAHTAAYFSSTGLNEQWDQGAGHVAGNRSVTMILNLEREASSQVSATELDVLTSTNKAAWVSIAAGLRVLTLHSTAGLPKTLIVTASGTVQRYLGLQLQTTGAGAIARLDAQFSVFVFVD